MQGGMSCGGRGVIDSKVLTNENAVNTLLLSVPNSESSFIPPFMPM